MATKVFNLFQSSVDSFSLREAYQGILRAGRYSGFNVANLIDDGSGGTEFEIEISHSQLKKTDAYNQLEANYSGIFMTPQGSSIHSDSVWSMMGTLQGDGTWLHQIVADYQYDIVNPNTYILTIGLLPCSTLSDPLPNPEKQTLLGHISVTESGGAVTNLTLLKAKVPYLGDGDDGVGQEDLTNAMAALNVMLHGLGYSVDNVILSNCTFYDDDNQPIGPTVVTGTLEVRGIPVYDPNGTYGIVPKQTSVKLKMNIGGLSVVTMSNDGLLGILIDVSGTKFATLGIDSFVTSGSMIIGSTGSLPKADHASETAYKYSYSIMYDSAHPNELQILFSLPKDLAVGTGNVTALVIEQEWVAKLIVP